MSSRMILFHIYISLKKSWRSRYRVLLYKNLSLRKSWCLLSLQYNVSYFGIRCILNNVLLQLHYQININNINSAWLKGIPEFLGSGRKCWTLDSGLWTLGPGRWTLDATLWTLSSEHCTLSLTVWEQNQNPFSYSAWLNYWKFFGCESLRTPWSRFFYRDYRFNLKCYVIKECRNKILLWEIELHYKQLSWTV